MTRLHHAPLRLALALAIILSVLGATPAEGSPIRAVYTQTQDPAGNQLVVFARGGDGMLVEQQRVSTGGLGVAATPPFGFPILDSQGGVELTEDRKLLFVVNAGSDTVSSFRATSDGAVLVDQEPSGGELPISVDSHKGLLFVLNEASGTISGLRYDKDGRMSPLPGSTRSLATPGGDGLAAQVGFDDAGRTLAVTERGTGLINRFVLDKNGIPGPSTTFPSAGETPFGFAWRGDDLLVSNAGHVGNPPDPFDAAQFNGSLSGYRTRKGAVTHAGTVPTERAACWVVLSKNRRYAFVTNTLSHSVSTLRVDAHAAPTLIGHTPTSQPPLEQGGALPVDLALSHEGRYLYVLSAIGGDGTSTIDVYRVGSHAELALIQTLQGVLPGGASGLAAS